MEYKVGDKVLVEAVLVEAVLTCNYKESGFFQLRIRHGDTDYNDTAYVWKGVLRPMVTGDPAIYDAEQAVLSGAEEWFKFTSVWINRSPRGVDALPAANKKLYQAVTNLNKLTKPPKPTEAEILAAERKVIDAVMDECSNNARSTEKRESAIKELAELRKRL